MPRTRETVPLALLALVAFASNSILRGLTATQAAILQLGVPVIAAFGAVAILGETVSPRLAISRVAVLGGIGLVLSERTTRR